MRIYEDVKYEVVQAHQTQDDWTPTATLNVLWKVYVDPTVEVKVKVRVRVKMNSI